jgi:hypothetical protein
MTIARGQMNRQLYQAGSGIDSLDIPMDERILISETLEPESREYINDEIMSEVDEEVMKRLMELQKNPEYQYDENNPYTGPRDMRMGGGIMNVPIKNNRVHAFGGFGGFVGDVVGGIGDIVGGAGDVVGDVVGGVGDVLGDIDLKEAIDIAAQIGSFIPGPHQPFAAAYTGARGSGIGGDFGGFQVGGFTPSGGMFGTTSTSGPSFASFQPQSGGFPGMPGGSKEFGLSDALRIGSQLARTQSKEQDTNQPSGDMLGFDINKVIENILGKVFSKEGAAAAGGAGLAALAYEDQKRIMEEIRKRIAQQRGDVAAYRQKLEDVAGTGRATGAPTTATDVVRSPVTAAQGGIINSRKGYMMGSEVPMRKNPAGIQELDYRQSGGFVPPIGIKEKADDIPAMLSNNEFVFTADAVRAAGGGSVNKGAQKMYALMKQLEGQA